jgi:hypothetical protein
MKIYSINFDPLSLPNSQFISFLDSRPEILNWICPFAGTVFLVSNHNGALIAGLISERFNNTQFVVNNISHIDGKMPNIVWDFIQKPKSSGRWNEMTPELLAQALFNQRTTDARNNQ